LKEMYNQMSHQASVRQLFLACTSVLQDNRTKLTVLFTAAVGIGFLVTSGNAAAGTMFQSPPSPVTSPPATVPPSGDGSATEQTAPTIDNEAPAEPVPPTSVPEAPPDLQEPRVREVQPDIANPDDSSNLILDQAEFIDSVVVSFAYIWLCCGVALILVIPLIFLFLQIRGRSKLNREGP
jgi:hypothetical protein